MRFSVLAAAVVVIGLFSTGPAALHQDAPAPQMGAIAEGTLSRGQFHQHPVQLGANEHVSIRVDQRGMDLVVQVRDPGGATIGEFDRELTVGGSEEVEITSSAGGTRTHLSFEPLPVPSNLVDLRFASSIAAGRPTRIGSCRKRGPYWSTPLDSRRPASSTTRG